MSGLTMRFITAFACAVMLIGLGVVPSHAAQRGGQSVSQIQPQEIPSKEGPGGEAAKEPPPRAATPSDPVGQFVSAILGDTEDRWNASTRLLELVGEEAIPYLCSAAAPLVIPQRN